MIKKLLISISLGCLSAALFAAEDPVLIYVSSADPVYEVGLHLGTELEVPLAKGLDFVWEEEVYTKNNFTGFGRLNSTLGLSYKVNRYFKFSTSYVFLLINKDGNTTNSDPDDDDEYWDYRHRANLTAIGTIKLGRFKLSLRERFKTTFRTDDYDELEKVNPKMLLQTRLKARYSIFGRPVVPFASVEMINPLNQNDYLNQCLENTDIDNSGIEKQWIVGMKYRLGVEWRLDKFSYLNFYYQFQQSFDRDVDVGTLGASDTDLSVTVVDGTTYTHLFSVSYIYSF